jgi:predicted Zn-dependent protease
VGTTADIVRAAGEPGTVKAQGQTRLHRRIQSSCAVSRFQPSVGLALAAVAASAFPAAAAEWVRVRSPHLEVLSDAPSASVVDAAVRLERFRVVLRALFPQAESPLEVPPVVVAFRHAADLERFTPRYRGRAVAADGFFLSGPEGRYIAIALAPGRRDAWEPVFHEYAHLVLAHVLPAQPVWVSEGLAELYGRWEPSAEGGLLGRPSQAHLDAVRRGMVPLDELIRVDAESPLYNEDERRNAFYATSWALAHYLVLGRDGGREQLQRFLTALTERSDVEGAFADAFGEAPWLMERRLEAYVRSVLPSAAVDTPPGPPVEPVATLASDALVSRSLGELLLLQMGRASETRSLLERALEQDPTDARTEVALARLASRAGRPREARVHLDAALRLSPDDPVALYGLAEAIQRDAVERGELLDGRALDSAVTALERAVALAPHLAEACDLLARLRPQPILGRIALLRRAVALNPGRAEPALTLANLLARVGQPGAAAAVLRAARENAREPHVRFLCGHLLSRLSLANVDTVEAAGRLVSLECSKEGALTFVMDAGEQRLSLRAPSPSGFLVHDADGETVEPTLVCGPQDAPVRALYRRIADDAGTLLSLTLTGRP